MINTNTLNIFKNILFLNISNIKLLIKEIEITEKAKI